MCTSSYNCGKVIGRDRIKFRSPTSWQLPTVPAKFPASFVTTGHRMLLQLRRSFWTAWMNIFMFKWELGEWGYASEEPRSLTLPPFYSYASISKLFKKSPAICGVRSGAVGWGHCATRRKVAGIFIDLILPAALWLWGRLRTIPLAEMSTRIMSWGVHATGA